MGLEFNCGAYRVILGFFMNTKPGMKPGWLLIAVLALTAAVLRAQNPTASPEKSTVAGTVVDAVSQQPVRDAVVAVRGTVGSERIPSPIASAATDSSGRFSFDNLQPGRYFVVASHEGYIRPEHGATTLNLASGQHLDDLVIYLTPGGTISGQVSNANRKPVPGVAVQALKRSRRFGKAEFEEVASTDTNEAGEYKLSGLLAGDYYLRAVPSQEQSKADAKDESKDKSNEVYVPSYFPGTRDQSGSTLLVLRGGEQMASMDITLSRVHPVVITGRVIDAATKLPVGRTELTLAEEGDVTPVSYAVTADAKGNFELKGVPRGSYMLVAEKPVQSQNDKVMWGRKPIQVGDVDLKNVEVAIRRGVEVSGRILVDGKANVDLTRLSGVLEPAQTSSIRGFMPEVGKASVKADGSFAFQDVPDGNYRLNFAPIAAGFYLKSAQSPDVLVTGVTVVRGQPVQSLELALSSGVGRLEGTVMKDEQPFPGATVVLVPDTERRSQPRYYRQTLSDGQGRFALQNIIPGDYEVFAWQEIERGSYLDPDFLSPFEDRGKAVSVKEGSALNLQIDVIPAE
jgi:hypothetical protein